MITITRITLEQAQYILATESEGSPLWAAANSIVSLYASNDILMTAAQESPTVEALETDIATWRERGRLLTDAVREAKNDETWEPSQIEGWK